MTEPTPTDFMAGVALFDELLRAAEKRALSEVELERDSMNIEARYRGAQALSHYALPFIETLHKRPEFAAGFAAALGDYVGMLQEGLAPAAGDQYTPLSFQDIVGPPPCVPAASNVAPFRQSVDGMPSLPRVRHQSLQLVVSAAA